MLIQFGPFEPDQPVIGQTTASVATNVVPLTDKSYGPFPSLSASTAALGARCQGAFMCRANDGTVHAFAGDSTNLYKLSGTTWTKVSKTDDVYTTPSDGYWWFAQIGDRIFATNYSDAIQTYVLNSSTDFADLSATAPKAKYMAVIKGALVVAGTNDGTDGEVQNRVWWPSLTDPTSWPTPGTAAAAAAQSDYQDIAPGGAIFGILPAVGGNDGAVWLADAIHRMNFSPGVIFDFQPAETGIGTTVPGSLIKIGSLAGYISEGGFQIWNGASTNIGHLKVNEYFWDNVDETKLNLVRTARHPKKNVIFWSWASSSATTNCDRILAYNFGTGWWSYIEATAELILSGFTAGYDLDTDAPYTSDADLDSTAPGLDSTAFMGGRVLMAGFDSSHQFGYFNGDNLAATIETGEFLDDNGGRVFVGGIKPIVTGAATLTAAVGYRDDLDDSVSYSTATSPASDRFCPQRVDTPYARARVTIAAAQDWSHAKGIIPRMSVSGER